jgi:NADH-quinone oxidoreductase subunit N
MIEIGYAGLFRLALPQTIVVVFGLLTLAADLLLRRRSSLQVRFGIGAALSSVGCVCATLLLLLGPQNANVLDGILVVNPISQLVEISLLVLTVLTVLISVGSTFTTHVGEYLVLILFATVGMMFLVSTENILMIFISLELLSLSLYTLTAFNKESAKSAEAALKYFLFGGMSAAFLLFGMSLLYGLSGSINLVKIAGAIPVTRLDAAWSVAIVTVVIGFGFKVAAVPFHLWAPDTYEGAPTPSAAFIASGSKLASFFIFARVMTVGFAGAEGSGIWLGYAPGWVPVLAVVAALSMLIGNLAAIAQSNVRRLLAYSAIAHAGYMLLAILAHTSGSLIALLYYAITYALTTLGAFGVVAVVEQHTGGSRMRDFAGFSRRAPVLSLCMLVFLLSLAGIPPLAGFFGKFYIFASVLQSGSGHLGLLWLVVLAIAMSAVSLYYYLQVLKRIYVAEPPAGSARIRVPLLTTAVMCLLAFGVVAFGCAPNLLLHWLQQAIHLSNY